MQVASSSTALDTNKFQSASFLEMATFAILIKLAISTATQEMEQLEKNAPLMNRVSASSVLGKKMPKINQVEAKARRDAKRTGRIICFVCGVEGHKANVCP